MANDLAVHNNGTTIRSRLWALIIGEVQLHIADADPVGHDHDIARPLAMRKQVHAAPLGQKTPIERSGPDCGMQPSDFLFSYVNLLCHGRYTREAFAYNSAIMNKVIWDKRSRCSLTDRHNSDPAWFYWRFGQWISHLVRSGISNESKLCRRWLSGTLFVVVLVSFDLMDFSRRELMRCFQKWYLILHVYFLLHHLH